VDALESIECKVYVTVAARFIVHSLPVSSWWLLSCLSNSPLLRNPELHYRVHKSPSLYPLCAINRFKLCLLTYFNSILPHRLRCPKWCLLPVRLCDWNFAVGTKVGSAHPKAAQRAWMFKSKCDKQQAHDTIFISFHPFQVRSFFDFHVALLNLRISRSLSFTACSHEVIEFKICFTNSHFNT
jgi:hypothetical protein